MKHIITLIMTLCLLFCTALPVMAMGTEFVSAAVGESGTGTSESPEATPTEAGEITPPSDFGDGDAEFYTKIRLTVTEWKGNPIAGAMYGLYEKSGKLIETLTTDRFGVAVSGDVPVNMGYYLQELYAPEGFQPNVEQHEIHLTDVTAPSRVDVAVAYDPILGRIRVTKTDESGKKLPGAVFGVYRDTDDKKLDTLTTGKNGTAELSLPAGDYYIRELEAPKGYIRSKTDTNFHLESGMLWELTVKNAAETAPEKTGLLRLRKEDGNTGDPLKNAVFGVYDGEGELVQELATGRDGLAELELAAGSYYLRELESPKGYLRDRSKVTFKITEDKTTRVTVENDKEKSVSSRPEQPKPEQPQPTPEPSKPGTSKPAPPVPGASDAGGKLCLVKLAAGSGSPLPGAVFGVYAQDGEKLAELTSGVDGRAAISLPAGRYYLKEQRAPYGYKPETARIRVDVLQNQTTLVEVTNEIDLDTPKMPEIQVPQTGIPFPALSYTLAAFLLCVAAFCGAKLIRSRDT